MNDSCMKGESPFHEKYDSSFADESMIHTWKGHLFMHEKVNHVYEKVKFT